MNFMSALSVYAQNEREREQRIRSRAVPQHVAIIMDGNRRWAKQRGLSAAIGHWQGADTLKIITEIASRIGVKVLTVYSFSTENWNRSPDEVASLMDLFERYLERECSSMQKEGVRLGHIGDIDGLPHSLRDKLFDVEEKTKNGKKIDLVLALNYGGRDEITRAVRSLAKRVQDGALDPDSISEKDIEQHLDTASHPFPELLIRTSGEMRISNFLLWQISYAELYVTRKLWPEFSKEEFLHAIEEYQERERRLGG